MISIRKAIPADNAPCRDLVQRSLASFGIAADFENLDRIAASFGVSDENNAIELVAEMDGQFAACLMLHPLHPLHPLYPLHPQTEAMANMTAKIFGFHVNAEYQGKGIGKTMLITALTEARRLGYSCVKLDTCERMHAAVSLYESTGWQRLADPSPDSGADRSYAYFFSSSFLA